MSCPNFDVKGPKKKNCRNKDSLQILPDPDGDKFCGKKGPDVSITADEGQMIFEAARKGKAGRGFRCLVECVGIGGCRE